MILGAFFFSMQVDDVKKFVKDNPKTAKVAVVAAAATVGVFLAPVATIVGIAGYAGWLLNKKDESNKPPTEGP